MKKDPLETLILLLAAMDLTPSEMKHLVEMLKDISASQLISRVNKIQHIFSSNQTPTDMPDRKIHTIHATYPNDLTVVDRVVRLLQGEAGLPTRYAAEKLIEMLVADGLLAVNNAPRVSKKSFREWVRRLQSRVDSKQLLRCATLIRNEFVNSRPSDWILKDTLR